MRIAVIGAGPAGLTAAHRLRAAGHGTTVIEARAVPGGRTHTEPLGPGHWSDDGAGWLGTFYPDTLALLTELGLRDRLRVLDLRGGGDLRIDSRLVPNPNSVPRILTTELLSPTEKLRFFTWMAKLFLTQRGNLRIDRRYTGGARRPEGFNNPNHAAQRYSWIRPPSTSLRSTDIRVVPRTCGVRLPAGQDAPSIKRNPGRAKRVRRTNGGRVRRTSHLRSSLETPYSRLGPHHLVVRNRSDHHRMWFGWRGSV